MLWLQQLSSTRPQIEVMFTMIINFQTADNSFHREFLTKFLAVTKGNVLMF